MTKPHDATIKAPDGLLLLPHLQVQNANAISSQLTWGFPAPTAFLGFSHALERRLADRFGQHFDGIGIVCHQHQAQTFKPNRRQHQVFTQSRNPVYLKREAIKFIDKGTPPAIVEEGRIHLKVSLLIAVYGGFDEALEEEDFADAAMETALGMRLAGGSVLPQEMNAPKAQWIGWPHALDNQHIEFRHLRRRLLPGFALVHRPDILAERLASLQAVDTNATVLEALLSLTGLNHIPPVLPDETTPNQADWQIEQRPGWLVPLPIGYASISDLYDPGQVTNVRDPSVPFRFVESLVSLGQWISPHRLDDLNQLLWRYGGDPQIGIYRTVNRCADLLAKRVSNNEPTQNSSQGA